MVNEEDYPVDEIVLDRVIEVLEGLSDDETWLKQILEVTNSSDKTEVVKVLNKAIRAVQSEFDF